MRVFLLGFMGTGKSYWGRRWAAQHQLDFFDLDHEIEQSTGLTIPQLFEQHGEAYFREKERERLLSFEGKDNFILSTGGGTPCFFDNMQWMNNIGLTIYLDTPIPVLKERLIKEQSHRPLIKTFNEEELGNYIAGSLRNRMFFYNQAHIKLATESISDITFDEIKKKYV
ncbi:MAG: shikimate kinase [Chitinophagaceae bacterium]|nr:shikimate kinase [Chitinophagaceae bacterium]